MILGQSGKGTWGDSRVLTIHFSFTWWGCIGVGLKISLELSVNILCTQTMLFKDPLGCYMETGLWGTNAGGRRGWGLVQFSKWEMTVSGPVRRPRRRGEVVGSEYILRVKWTRSPDVLTVRCDGEALEMTPRFLAWASSRGVQSFGISVPHWKKKSCFGRHIKYTETCNHTQKSLIMF